MTMTLKRLNFCPDNGKLESECQSSRESCLHSSPSSFITHNLSDLQVRVCSTKLHQLLHHITTGVNELNIANVLDSGSTPSIQSFNL